MHSVVLQMCQILGPFASILLLHCHPTPSAHTADGLLFPPCEATTRKMQLYCEYIIDNIYDPIAPYVPDVINIRDCWLVKQVLFGVSKHLTGHHTPSLPPPPTPHPSRTSSALPPAPLIAAYTLAFNSGWRSLAVSINGCSLWLRNAGRTLIPNSRRAFGLGAHFARAASIGRGLLQAARALLLRPDAHAEEMMLLEMVNQCLRARVHESVSRTIVLPNSTKRNE